jgi:hypothetical protein
MISIASESGTVPSNPQLPDISCSEILSPSRHSTAGWTLDSVKGRVVEIVRQGVRGTVLSTCLFLPGASIVGLFGFP